MQLWDKAFFIPSLIPENSRIEEYLHFLTEALTSTLSKIVLEVPAWADAFKFDEETELAKKKNEMSTEIERIDNRLAGLQQFKRLLLVYGDELVRVVVMALKDGFGFDVDQTDEFREDIKILDSQGQAVVFGEIKGTNKGARREYINQADSHRERAGLPPDFPVVLVINTHIKNARDLEEKDQVVPNEQVRHAATNKVLILRTLDLLRLLRMTMRGCITSNEVLALMREQSGWLRVWDDR